MFLFIGNRTPKQVSSRVQKYFIKLLRAGLPIPGRGPKVKFDVKKGFNHRHQRNNYMLFKRSTFFPHQDLSFVTNEESKEQPIIEESVSSLLKIVFLSYLKLIIIKFITFKILISFS